MIQSFIPKMMSSLVTVALLCTTVLAAVPNKRQATNTAQFTSAADQLISKYIPSTALPGLESAVSSAASAASVSGDAKSLIYSALVATRVPGWFASAVPTGWATQIAALEEDINALRETPSGIATATVIIVVTTTNSAGSTITTSETATGAPATETTVSGSVSGSGGSGTTGSTGTITTTATTTDHPLSGAGSTASSLTTKVISGITSVLTVAVSGATSAASGAKSGGSSIVSEATRSTSSSMAGAAMPTVVSGAAGVLGLVGVMMAL